MKYTKKMVSKICEYIKADSYTIAEICRLVGITEETFYSWKREKAEFSDAIEKAKSKFIADGLVECEKSLMKLIRGYEYDEKKTVFVESKDKDGKSTPKIKEQTTVKKHVAPSLGAIIHFQTNNDPDNWKNRQSTEVSGKDGKDLFPDIKVEIIDKREEVENTDDKDLQPG